MVAALHPCSVSVPKELTPNEHVSGLLYLVVFGMWKTIAWGVHYPASWAVASGLADEFIKIKIGKVMTGRFIGEVYEWTCPIMHF